MGIAGEIHMTIFKLKTSDAKIFDAYKKGQNILKIDHLIQYEDEIYIGAPVLLLFGGDGTPWVNGLYAIAEIHSKPLELGYESAARGQYYKLEIEVVLRLERVFEKSDFIRYPESFDSGVAPSTKGERNQALGIIDDDGSSKTIASICRALLDSQPNYEAKLREIFGKQIIDYSLNNSIVYEPVQNVQDEAEKSQEQQSDFMNRQIICFGAPGTGKSFLLQQVAKEFEKQDYININLEKRKKQFDEYIRELQANGVINEKKANEYIESLNNEGPFSRKIIELNEIIQIKKELTLRKNDESKKSEYWFIKRYLDCMMQESSFVRHVERVTFHPHYTYAQFVGSYKPVQDSDDKSQIRYEFVPGPFMRVYKRAKRDPKHNFLLVIEEINRANTAAVFGDTFQLLDRKKGVSEYPVATSEDIKQYLKINGVFNSEELRIPSNMYICATMNSADQGVFPMDTAFKRRWEFEYIGIDENEDGIANYEIPLQKKQDGTHEWVKWNDLRHSINDKLTEMKINEDKLLGPYFISEEKLKLVEGKKEENADEFVKSFKSKVLMYLFEDAAKMHHGDLFDENAIGRLRFSDICKKFDEIGKGIFKF